MPHLLLNAHQAHLLIQIQSCTGEEDPFEAIDLFIDSAVTAINKNWLPKFAFMAVMNLGTTINAAKYRHCKPEEVGRIFGVRRGEWEMSVEALRAHTESDLAVEHVLHYYDTVFADYISLGAMVALMTHYDIPTGLGEDYANATKPVLGYFLANLLKTEMLLQQKFGER